MDFRKRVISEIHAQGFFKIKGSVNHVAKALGVTRYTVYNYLDKLNDKV
ncbi:helix-turn-helix domain-containing protein [Citrobacter sp. RHBSTW-00013]|nr:helix-turn-helix domain-containing protein [Citrobacter sp. RHBSTW-00013]